MAEGRHAFSAVLNSIKRNTGAGTRVIIINGTCLAVNIDAAM